MSSQTTTIQLTSSWFQFNSIQYQFNTTNALPIQVSLMRIDFNSSRYKSFHVNSIHVMPIQSNPKPTQCQCNPMHPIPIRFQPNSLQFHFKSTWCNSCPIQLDWIRFKWIQVQTNTNQLHAIYRNPIRVNRIWSYPNESGRFPSNTSQPFRVNSIQCNSTQPNSIQWISSQSDTIKSIQISRIHANPVSIQFQFNGKQINWIEFKSMRYSPIQPISIQSMQSNFNQLNSPQFQFNRFNSSQVKWSQDNSSRMDSNRIQLHSSSNAIALNFNPIQVNARHFNTIHFNSKQVS